MKDILLTGVKWMMWTIRYCTSRCETRRRRRRRLRKGERKEEEGGVNGAFMLTGRSFLAEGGGGLGASECVLDGGRQWPCRADVGPSPPEGEHHSIARVRGSGNWFPRIDVLALTASVLLSRWPDS